MRANWEKLKATMMEGELPRELKEVIALFVSQDNNCEYCIQAHSGALKSLGVGETAIQAIRRGEIAAAGFEDREVRLVALMRRVNDRSHDVSGADIEAMRTAGYGNAQIVEAFGVMETFVGFNKFLDALEVEIG